MKKNTLIAVVYLWGIRLFSERICKFTFPSSPAVAIVSPDLSTEIEFTLPACEVKILNSLFFPLKSKIFPEFVPIAVYLSCSAIAVYISDSACYAIIQNKIERYFFYIILKTRVIQVRLCWFGRLWLIIWHSSKIKRKVTVIPFFERQKQIADTTKHPTGKRLKFAVH